MVRADLVPIGDSYAYSDPAKHMLSMAGLPIVRWFIHQGRHYDVSTQRRPINTGAANNLLTIIHHCMQSTRRQYTMDSGCCMLLVIRFIIVVIGPPCIELLTADVPSVSQLLSVFLWTRRLLSSTLYHQFINIVIIVVIIRLGRACSVTRSC